ncbi:NUDIX domain-containing protein [Streptomyces sp. WAC05374]|nr:NUDIX domain-containing protein [Streptomyces sp. WAC05374]
MNEEAYGALRASHALWAGTSVLITDQRGRVLLQRVTYRPARLLPGGAVDKGESPAQGASRELEEELGVTATVTRGLAVDWVSPAGRTTPPAMRELRPSSGPFGGCTKGEHQVDHRMPSNVPSAWRLAP